jgi:four helix bundle protein
MEVETLMLISKNLNYVNDKNFELISNKIEETGKILQGLIKSMQQKINIANSE